MANLFNSLYGNLKGGLSRMGNAFLGTVPQTQQPQQSVTTVYPQDMQTFFDNLPQNQSLMTKINNSPFNQGYSDDEVKQKIAQGFNLGIPEIANEQAKWGIGIPKTDFQKQAADLGQFNFYPTQINTGVASAPRQGGFLNDFMLGARENYNQGFDPSNWGGKKNFATRLGEGLGTGLRFLDSSAGRGLLTAGLIGALGGTPAEIAGYGIQAGVGRQQNRTKDQLYRKQLAEQGIDTSDITGNIDDDIYKNVSNMQNKITNTVIRQQATESMNKLRELQIEKQKILNSTLPQEQKAKLIKLNAEAAHAEELILAKIQAYENGSMLGWANYGLRADANNRANQKDAREAAKEAKEQQVLDELINGGNGGNSKPASNKTNNKGWAF